ncbi:MULTISPECIES: ABC transporter permease [Pannonibacter]|uniref:ABC transporter permease n=1 Tax=Pannonibacter TaxID=227873 RepID=UPI000F0352C5|nr:MULTISPECIES: ABC transporter permease [Pannonibacter]MBA4206476.1 ABC transporter permease [Polymorphum sp.]
MDRLISIFRLGLKELQSLRRDPVLLILILWAFSAGVYMAADGMRSDLNNVAVAVVDEDRSPLSRQLIDTLRPPEFRKPELISFAEIDRGLDTQAYSFVLVIPERFEADVVRGNTPKILLNIDATAMMQAGTGANHIAQAFAQEIARYQHGRGIAAAAMPVDLIIRYAFNPNLTSSWFSAIMEIINNITMLTVVLTGAAVMREREHGTLEHLLSMPLTPFEIMMAKVWANGLVILVVAGLSLKIVIEQLLGVPVAGSVALFLSGTALYLFFASALGILLGTIARSMPQFGLLFILTILPMNLLSGGETPIESQPLMLRTLMSAVPSTQFVSMAQAVLYRGADFWIVWPKFVAMTLVGLLLFTLAAIRFRKSIAAAH